MHKHQNEQHHLRFLLNIFPNYSLASLLPSSLEVRDQELSAGTQAALIVLTTLVGFVVLATAVALLTLVALATIASSCLPHRPH